MKSFPLHWHYFQITTKNFSRCSVCICVCICICICIFMIAVGFSFSFVFVFVCIISFVLVTTFGFSMQSSSGTTTNEGFAKTPEAIIFDIDGTLADSWKLGFEATLVVLQNNNISLIDEATYHECTKFSTPQRLARHAGLEPVELTPGKEIDETAKALFESTGQKLADEFDELYVGLVTTKTAGFFEGIRHVFQRINSVPSTKVGCLTNACVAYAHAVLKVNDDDELNLVKECRSVHGADTVPAPKPEPDGLYKVCRELGVSPSNAVYVGDSPSDGLAAKASGMHSVGVTWGSHSEESLKKAPFDFYASTPDELCRILNLH